MIFNVVKFGIYHGNVWGLTHFYRQPQVAIKATEVFGNLVLTISFGNCCLKEKIGSSYGSLLKYVRNLFLLFSNGLTLCFKVQFELLK